MFAGASSPARPSQARPQTSTMAMAAAESDPFRGADGRADAKVELMRRRNAERVARLLNARERTIGIDAAALLALGWERSTCDLALERVRIRVALCLRLRGKKGALEAVAANKSMTR